jgi:hypothetical protein
MRSLLHASRNSAKAGPLVIRQRPRLIARSADRQVEHYTSEQAQDACLVSDRYGEGRTACTRSEKQRCASAKAITAHCRAGRVILGDSSKCARGKVSRCAASCTPSPISTRRPASSPARNADPTPFEAVEQVTVGVESGIAHGARAGTLTFPKICRLAAGWLREGADHLRRPVQRTALHLYRARQFAPLSSSSCRALLLSVSSPSLP